MSYHPAALVASPGSCYSDNDDINRYLSEDPVASALARGSPVSVHDHSAGKPLPPPPLTPPPQLEELGFGISWPAGDYNAEGVLHLPRRALVTPPLTAGDSSGPPPLEDLTEAVPPPAKRRAVPLVGPAPSVARAVTAREPVAWLRTEHARDVGAVAFFAQDAVGSIPPADHGTPLAPPPSRVQQPFAPSQVPAGPASPALQPVLQTQTRVRPSHVAPPAGLQEQPLHPRARRSERNAGAQQAGVAGAPVPEWTVRTFQLGHQSKAPKEVTGTATDPLLGRCENYHMLRVAYPDDADPAVPVKAALSFSTKDVRMDQLLEDARRGHDRASAMRVEVVFVDKGWLSTETLYPAGTPGLNAGDRTEAAARVRPTVVFNDKIKLPPRPRPALEVMFRPQKSVLDSITQNKQVCDALGMAQVQRGGTGSIRLRARLVLAYQTVSGAAARAEVGAEWMVSFQSSAAAQRSRVKQAGGGAASSPRASSTGSTAASAASPSHAAKSKSKGRKRSRG